MMEPEWRSRKGHTRLTDEHLSTVLLALAVLERVLQHLVVFPAISCVAV